MSNLQSGWASFYSGREQGRTREARYLQEIEMSPGESRKGVE